MDDKRQFKLLSVNYINKKKTKKITGPLCLNKPNPVNMLQLRDTGNNSLLTDDESDTSFDNKYLDSNPIFSSSSSEPKIEKQSEESKSDNTFCSAIEEDTATTVKKVVSDGSESLFSTESSKTVSQEIEQQLSQHVSQLLLGERFSGVRRHTGSISEPLHVPTDSCSIIGETFSKDSSYCDFYDRELRSGYDKTQDTYREKAEGGESPEKAYSEIDDTKDNTDSLDDTEVDTSNENKEIDLTCVKIENDEIVSISSGPCSEDNNSSESSTEDSVISVSDSDDSQPENLDTNASSELSAMVSTITDSVSTMASSVNDRFFDNVPLMPTPECSKFMENFDPRRGNTKDNDEIPHASEIEEEIIPESEPEPDSQPKSPEHTITPEESPKLESPKTTQESSQEQVTEINISANVQISININTTGTSSTTTKVVTPVVSVNQSPVYTGTKRKEPSNSSNKVPNSPQPGPSKPYEPERTFRSRQFRKPEKENAKDLKNVQNQQAKAANDSIVVDDFTSHVLDEIYGKDKWQTPQLMAKTVKRTGPENTLLDFSTFNRNVCPKLESTRLTTPLSQNPPMNTRRSPGRVSKPSTAKKIIRPKALAICDSDTSSEDPITTDDESWSGQSSPNSTDSEIDQARRPISTRKRVIRPPSYSGSDNDIDDAWTDKPSTVKSPLGNVLDSCEYKPKEKMPPTPATGTKTKRKLFNPNKTVDECSGVDDEVQKNLVPVPVQEHSVPRDMDHDISQIQDDALSFRFDLPLLPKAVERIKDKTPAKTPSKKIETPTTKTKKIVQVTQKTAVPSKKLSFLQSLDVNTSEQLCDPEALRYRQNYKTLKQELTDKLFTIYNEQVFENELVAPCSWNKKLLNTAGRCHLSRVSGTRKARIELSEKVLTSADRLRCTLIHEMCHAATWIFNGEDGHGRTWKAWAHKANTIFKELPKINTCHSYEIFYKYTYMCKLCKAKSQAHSKSKKVENIRCKFCHGSIEILLNKITKDGNVVSTPVRQATGFSKYVKENYTKVKRPNMAHADIMKVLGLDYGKLKLN